MKIVDPSPLPQDDFAARYAQIQEALVAAGATPEDTRQVPLLADVDTILEETVDFLANSGPNIILDITSMPKWWFFPVVRFLLADRRVQNLVVTYSSAVKYDEQLSSDPAPLAPLPTFDEPPIRNCHDELIVAVGFTPLGLRDLFAVDVDKIRYLFPFPPGPPSFFRNWDFLRILEAEIENRSMRAEDPWAVHMYDLPSIFQALSIFTRNGERTAALAPFGPKTLSVAMCLFALAASNSEKPPVHVFYTQPKRYSLDYTTGIKRINGVPDVKAYCVRLGNRDLYSLN